MPRKPALTDESFFLAIFRPKKNPLPSGLRKRPLSGLKGGRKQARLNAYNKMSAEKQELLRRSGRLDYYLRGESTYAQAKRFFRVQAESRGVIPPVKRKNLGGIRQDPHYNRNLAYVHLTRLNTSSRRSQNTILKNVGIMTDAQTIAAQKIKNETELRTLAQGNSDEWRSQMSDDYENVLWYH